MFKRNVFCVGLVGTLAVLSFMVGVWDGINIKPRRRPAAVAYYKDDIIINNIEYNLPNRNSRGLRLSPNVDSSNPKRDSNPPKDDNYLKDEFIDIPKVAQNRKAKKKKSPTLRNKFLGKNKKQHRMQPQLPRTPYLAPIFSFKAMALPKSSTQHPFTYAKHLIQSRLKLELLNGTNLHDSKPKSKLSLDELEEDIKNLVNSVNQSGENNEVSKLGTLISPSKARHVLIATTWRSGSTFLGDLFNRYPGVFYSFEPLHYIDHKYGALSDNPDEKKEEHVRLVSEVFKCKPESGYFIHANKPENRFLFKHNFRLWNVCENLLMASAACFMPELYLKTCPIFPIRVIKTVRMRVAETENLLLDPELKDTLKIVFLVRDPRGVMNSRSSMDWCRQKTCSDAYTVCKDLTADIIAALHLKKKYPGRIHLIRYEDLSVDPFGMTDKLLDFLDFAPNQLIERFLEGHTKTTRRTSTTSKTIETTPNENNSKHVRSDAYSTTKNSKATAFKWKKKMKSKDILKVQRVCKKPMRMLGYNPMPNIIENRNDDNFPLIVKTSKELWP